MEAEEEEAQKKRRMQAPENWLVSEASLGYRSPRRF